MTLDQAIEKIKRNTRVYSKKQVTWYKKDPDMHWFSPDDKEAIIEYIDGGSKSNLSFSLDSASGSE